jgi:hypothetical protein
MVKYYCFTMLHIYIYILKNHQGEVEFVQSTIFSVISIKWVWRDNMAWGHDGRSHPAATPPLVGWPLGSDSKLVLAMILEEDFWTIMYFTWSSVATRGSYQVDGLTRITCGVRLWPLHREGQFEVYNSEDLPYSFLISIWFLSTHRKQDVAEPIS